MESQEYVIYKMTYCMKINSLNDEVIHIHITHITYLNLTLF